MTQNKLDARSGVRLDRSVRIGQLGRRRLGFACLFPHRSQRQRSFRKRPGPIRRANSIAVQEIVSEPTGGMHLSWRAYAGPAFMFIKKVDIPFS